MQNKLNFFETYL